MNEAEQSEQHRVMKEARILSRQLAQEEERHRQEKRPAGQPLTVFHVTHPKAGSQWVYQLLLMTDGGRCVTPVEDLTHFQTPQLQMGRIYPTVYTTRIQFYRVLAPWKIANTRIDPQYADNWRRYSADPLGCRIFFIYRDLRDTLVSLYFSLRDSHDPASSESVREFRTVLREKSVEDGMLLLAAERLQWYARVQQSWLDAADPDVLILTYEELIRGTYAAFRRILDHCGIACADRDLRKITDDLSFEKQTGVKPGTEDHHRHLRKGISGDWRNYFTPALKDLFKRNFNDLLVKAGYEHDDCW